MKNQSQKPLERFEKELKGWGGTKWGRYGNLEIRICTKSLALLVAKLPEPSSAWHLTMGEVPDAVQLAAAQTTATSHCTALQPPWLPVTAAGTARNFKQVSGSAWLFPTLGRKELSPVSL